MITISNIDDVVTGRLMAAADAHAEEKYGGCYEDLDEVISRGEGDDHAIWLDEDRTGVYFTAVEELMVDEGLDERDAMRCWQAREDEWEREEDMEWAMEAQLEAQAGYDERAWRDEARARRTAWAGMVSLALVGVLTWLGMAGVYS